MKHPYGTFYLHSVLYSFLLVIWKTTLPGTLVSSPLDDRWGNSHREGLGHTARTRLILSPGSCCLHLIHSTLLRWTASICPSRSTLLCLGKLTYIPNSLPSILHWHLATAGHWREIPGREEMTAGAFNFPALFLKGHIRTAATLDQKPWLLSRSWLSLGCSNGPLPYLLGQRVVMTPSPPLPVPGCGINPFSFIVCYRICCFYKHL